MIRDLLTVVSVMTAIIEVPGHGDPVNQQGRRDVANVFGDRQDARTVAAHAGPGGAPAPRDRRGGRGIRP